MESLKVTPRHKRTLRMIAASLRRRSEQVEPAFSTRQIIDECFPGTIVTGRRLPPDVDELVKVDKLAFRTHRAPHVIYYNRDLPSADQRYAIAHAIAHIVFDGARRRGCAEDARREIRCDRFADELLVPLVELRPYISVFPSHDPEKNETYLDQVDQIASHFHAPARVIDKQIREIRRAR